MIGGIERQTRAELSARAHFAAYLPLAEPASVELETVYDKVKTLVSHGGAEVFLHPRQKKLEQGGGRLFGFRGGGREPKMFFLVVSGVGIWIVLREAPLNGVVDLPKWVNPETWPDGLDGMRGHRAAIEIYDLGLMKGSVGPVLDVAFNRAVAVTVAAAAMAQIVPPLGLLWHPARGALPPAAFRDQIGRVIQGAAPLELWMRWYYLRPEPGERPGVITRGLMPFVGREIEVRPSGHDEADALTLTFAFASLLIDHGANVVTGATVSPTPRLAARVRVGDSRMRRGMPVYELTFRNRGQTG